MNIKNYFWLLPFISFALGYAIIQSIFRVESIPTPHLVGKYLHEALPLLSFHNLNIRLISEKEESSLPEGLILNQSPQPGTLIKPNQTIFIVTTKKPIGILCPQCIGKKEEAIATTLKEKNIFPCIYSMHHHYPEKLCFAQWPEHNETIENNKIILYVSSNNNTPIIWPHFIGRTLKEVVDFLENYQIKPYIINDSPDFNGDNSIVIDQRPIAGTLLTIDSRQPLSVQLRIH